MNEEVVAAEVTETIETAEKVVENSESFSDVTHHVADVAVEKTNEFVNYMKSLITWGHLFRLIGAIIILLILWVIYKCVRKALKKVPEEKVSAHNMMILQKGVKYLFYLVSGMYILSLFGVNINAIWGAAGIAGLAIGFAAQTSVSNLISGVFVLSEKTMKVGDYITVGGESGIVDSVGLLSVKIHTLDNQMIRIPNSTIINSNFTNNSYFPRKRMTFAVSIDYKTDMKTALAAIKTVPELCSTVLEEPAPAAWFDGFDDSGIKMTLAVWFIPSDLIQTKNDVFIGIKQRFDEAGINIPFNRLDVSVLEGGKS